MGDWKSVLKADPMDWLLEEDNPSVRHLALVDILERPADDPEAIESKRDIMTAGIVPKILARMNGGGYWEEPEGFYTSKNKGTVWQLIILAELGADGNDERLGRACEFILENSQDRDSGGFAMHSSAKAGGGRHSEVIPCLTGNMVWSMIRLGHLSDPRIRRGIDWITSFQRFDDMIDNPPHGWPYDKAVVCWDRHTCHMSVVKALKALSAIPGDDRSAEVQRALDEGAEFLLLHHIHKRSHDLARVSKPGWLKPGFPLMYQTDVLEILGILTHLGYRDARMREAVDVICNAQDADGKWKLANTYNGRFQADIETKGEPSKWVTVNALRVLKRFYG